MPRKNYNCRACCDKDCVPASSAITLQADKPAINKITTDNTTYDVRFPAVLTGNDQLYVFTDYEAVPVKAKFRWGCDADGKNAAIEVRVSRVVDNAEDRPWKTLMFDAAGVDVFPSGISNGRCKWPKSFFYELELLRNGQSVSKVMIPTMPARTEVYSDLFSPWRVTPREFSHVAFDVRVTHKRIGAESVVAVYVGTWGNRKDGGYPGTNQMRGTWAAAELQSFVSVIHTFSPSGVRHIFDAIDVEFTDDYTSLECDVAIPATLVTSIVTQEIPSALPSDAGLAVCDPTAPAILPENVDDPFPYIQLTQCEYRKRRGHVTNSAEGKDFTKLKMTAGDLNVTLGNTADDGTPLADGTFWWAGDRYVELFGNTTFAKLQGVVRVEVAASIITSPGLPCSASYNFGTFHDGNWQTLVAITMRMNGTAYWHGVRYIGNHPSEGFENNNVGNYRSVPGAPFPYNGFNFLRGEPVTIDFYVSRMAWIFAPDTWDNPIAPFDLITLQLL